MPIFSAHGHYASATDVVLPLHVGFLAHWLPACDKLACASGSDVLCCRMDEDWPNNHVLTKRQQNMMSDLITMSSGNLMLHAVAR